MRFRLVVGPRAISNHLRIEECCVPPRFDVRALIPFWTLDLNMLLVGNRGHIPGAVKQVEFITHRVTVRLLL